MILSEIIGRSVADAAEFVLDQPPLGVAVEVALHVHREQLIFGNRQLVAIGGREFKIGHVKLKTQPD